MKMAKLDGKNGQVETKAEKIVLVKIVSRNQIVDGTHRELSKVKIRCRQPHEGGGSSVLSCKMLCNISTICDYATKRNLQSVKVSTMTTGLQQDNSSNYFYSSLVCLSVG